MPGRRTSRYDELEAKALFNFELLLNRWGIDYVKLSDVEYDFLSPTRKDTNHGACRFNTAKGVGADFAGASFSSEDFKRVGPTLDASDFAPYVEGSTNNWGYNVIGLCQRVHGLKSYTEAVTLLQDQIGELEANPDFVKATKQNIHVRKERRESDIQEKIRAAGRIWEKCDPIEGTLGEVYLATRGIFLTTPEPSIRYHPLVMNGELKRPLPALLFLVQTVPSAPLCAIHRIYLQSDGLGKAPVENPKMALGSVKGAGIWFGTPGKRLSIVEGPENALSILVLGASFVVSTINAVNFSSLSLPSYVEEVVLLPDGDAAGKLAGQKATMAYQEQGKRVKIQYPPQIDGMKKFDWNNLLIA